eukprot:5965653-Amphidinium_carterae.1
MLSAFLVNSTIEGRRKPRHASKSSADVSEQPPSRERGPLSRQSSYGTQRSDLIHLNPHYKNVIIRLEAPPVCSCRMGANLIPLGMEESRDSEGLGGSKTTAKGRYAWMTAGMLEQHVRILHYDGMNNHKQKNHKASPNLLVKALSIHCFATTKQNRKKNAGHPVLSTTLQNLNAC